MKIIKCSNCKKDKCEDEFSVRSGKRNVQCKSCREYYNTLWSNNSNDYKEKRKEYYRANKEKHRLRNFRNAILKKYALSVESYEEMLKAQYNRCEICGIEFENTGSKTDLHKLPCIDHSHQTNKVRGLLCRKCNITLSYVKSGFIEKANRYLQFYEAQDKEPA